MARKAAAPLVVVHWGDAWEGGDDIGHRAWATESVGYVVERNRKGIRIAGCVDEEGEFSRFLFVPAGMVVKVEVLDAGSE